MPGFFGFRDWLRSTRVKANGKAPARPLARLRLETLEDRLPPGDLFAALTGFGLAAAPSSTPAKAPASAIPAASAPAKGGDASVLPPSTIAPTYSAPAPAALGSVAPGTTSAGDSAFSLFYAPATTSASKTGSTGSAGSGAAAPVNGGGGTSSAPQPPALPPSVTDAKNAAGQSVANRDTNEKNLTLSGLAAANASVQVKVDGQVKGTATANGQGKWTFQATGLADGRHIFTASAGGTTSGVGVTTTVDTTPPTVTLSDVKQSRGVLTAKVAVSGEAASMFNVTFDVDRNRDGDFNDANEKGFATGFASNQPTTLTLPTLPGGNFLVRARVTDAAGNEGVSEAKKVAVPLVYVPDPNASANYPPNRYVPVGGLAARPIGVLGDGATRGNGAGTATGSGNGGRRVAPSTIGETEPNDTTTNANDFTVTPTDPGILNGAIDTGSDVDTYRFTLAARAAVFIDVNSVRTGLSTTLDSVVTLLDSSGNQLDQNDNGYNFETGLSAQYVTADATTADSSLYRELGAGTYFIQVSSNSSTTGAYQVKVRADTNFSSTVPQFNSNPGASNTVYLDFDGHSSSTDAWTSSGSYTATAFDMSFNNNANEWSPGETELIRQIIRTMAEDYAPFDVNFTTIDPGTITDGTSIRMIFTNSDPSIVGQGTSTLGVAFLGSFNNSDDTDNVMWGAFNPTFASYNSFSGGTSGDIEALGIVIGDTGTHELGHTLNLDHYQNSPNLIMNDTNFGLGGKRWENGTNVSGTAQDDMQVIASLGSFNNSVSYRADDAGNDIGSATPLAPAGNVYSFNGVISVLNTSSPANNDVDYFRILAAGSGQTTIVADVDEYLNNLNVTLNVYDASGTLVGSDSPSSSFDGRLTLTLADGGVYYVAVGSNGGAGEAGQYRLTVTTPAAPPVNGLSGDPMEPNETSDTANQLGTLLNVATYSGLSITTHADTGLPDYDWYAFTLGLGGAFSAQVSNTSLEVHVFSLSGGYLTEVANGTGFAAGSVVYVEVKGQNTAPGVYSQGAYTLTVAA